MPAAIRGYFAALGHPTVLRRYLVESFHQRDAGAGHAVSFQLPLGYSCKNPVRQGIGRTDYLLPYIWKT